MTILGRGDLVPRRRRHRPVRWLAGLVVIAVAAAGGYAGYRHWHHRSPHRVASTRPCQGHPAVVPTPQPSDVRVAVRNATLRTGLASRVAHALRQRQVHVVSIGNTPLRGKGVATVRYTADRRSQAEVLAAQIRGATMAPEPGHGRLELDLGPRFHGLAPARVAGDQLTREVAATASPTPTPRCGP